MSVSASENACARQISRREYRAGAGKIGGSGQPDFCIRARREACEQRVDDLAFHERVGTERIGVDVDAFHNDKRPRIEAQGEPSG